MNLFTVGMTLIANNSETIYIAFERNEVISLSGKVITKKSFVFKKNLLYFG